MPEPDLRAMFIRLNRNVVALNKQELRHATYWGKFLRCCEGISDDDTWSTFGLFTPNDFRRMLDVEFVSELVAAYLHGPQNKKANLEKYYSAYEEEFERERDVRKAFRKALDEITEVLPSLERTRWRKKSDFYTLFLCFAERSASLPFASDVRGDLSNALKEFASEVDIYVADSEGTGTHSEPVRRYGNAVQRAASDLANRKTRRTELDGVFKSLMQGR